MYESYLVVDFDFGVTFFGFVTGVFSFSISWKKFQTLEQKQNFEKFDFFFRIVRNWNELLIIKICSEQNREIGSFIPQFKFIRMITWSYLIFWRKFYGYKPSSHFPSYRGALSNLILIGRPGYWPIPKNLSDPFWSEQLRHFFVQLHPKKINVRTVFTKPGRSILRVC